MALSSQKIFIAGEWVETSKPLPVVDPLTGQVFGQTFLAEPAHIERALVQLSASFKRVPLIPASQRAEVCAAVARKLTERAQDFAKLIVKEAGKPVTDALREVKRAAAVFELAAAEARKAEGESLSLDSAPGTEPRQGTLRRFPSGPLFAVTPFNFPLNLVAHKVAPAIACGCPFILKPSPKTPLTALLLAHVLLESGLGPVRFAVFPAENADTEKLVADPRIKVFSFTGSAAVGWKLKALAPKKKVVLELGGNAAVILEPDALLDLAVKRVAAGGFGYAGQTCISVQRVFAHQKIFQTFTDALVARTRSLVSGDPSKPETEVGPMISEEAAKRVESWVNEAVVGGAKVLCGGKRNGSFYEPTLLTGVKPDMKISCEEVFGPVVTLEHYSDFAKALEMINDGPYGLQAGVFTNDQNKIQLAFETLEMGAILINEVPTWRADAMPYGGVKDSGFGREGVKYAMEEYTEPRLLVINSEPKPK